MKVKPEHYQQMLEAIRPLVTQVAAHRERLKTDSRVKDLEKRLRWDLLYASRCELAAHYISDTLYPYCNDEHIDTALKAIVKELGI
jgi:hypothetical protein